jgi:hypothetical protein
MRARTVRILTLAALALGGLGVSRAGAHAGFVDLSGGPGQYMVWPAFGERDAP